MNALSLPKCEEIARKVCEILGQDPDQMVQIPSSSLLNPDGSPQIQEVPYWTMLAHMVPEQVAWFRAITQVLFKRETH